MVLRSVIFFLCPFLLCFFPAAAQKKQDFKEPRILILLDGSSSMINQWSQGQNRFQTAGQIVLRLMDSIYTINDQVAFSLRVYGHQYGVAQNNCYDTRREVMFSKDNYTQMALRLQHLHPMGVSPIAYSLKEAAENDFANEQDYAYSLVLITDGGESCGGDICEVVKSLIEKKIQFRPYIISLVDYAPLKEQYACLGNYLTVSKPSEIGAVIGKITEAYRKVLSIPVPKPKELQADAVPPSGVQKIKTQTVYVPAPEKETAAASTIPEKQAEPGKAEPGEKPAAAAVKPSDSKIKVETSFFPKETIAFLKTPKIRSIDFPLFWSVVTPKKRPVPQFPLPKPEPGEVAAATTPPVPASQAKLQSQSASKPTSKPMAKPVQPPVVFNIRSEKKEASFSTATEPAPETLLEIYFTDGKGKFYNSTPPMQLTELNGGRVVKKFFRTTNASGNPDPQIVPPGKYTLLIGKTGNYIAKNLVIEPDKRNKVTIVVTKGSLSFAYGDNLKRPVKEFSAYVKKNFEARAVARQACTEELEYDPGNYHIEINTLPVSRRNVDLDFGVNVRIDLDEPGFVKFTNTAALGKISLWMPLGDQFVRFHIMEIPGNPEKQKLQLLPGTYEVHWKKNPNLPLEPDAIQTFLVKSNETTEVEIR